MDNIDLNGDYRISSVSDYNGPLEKKSDGKTTITDNHTSRTDDAGCKWVSHFSIIDEKTVEMTSIADPSEADPDFCLIDPTGKLTRDSVEYKSTLNLMRKGDKIRLSGKIYHGADTIFLTMTKI